MDLRVTTPQQCNELSAVPKHNIPTSSLALSMFAHLSGFLRLPEAVSSCALSS